MVTIKYRDIFGKSHDLILRRGNRKKDVEIHAFEMGDYFEEPYGLLTRDLDVKGLPPNTAFLDTPSFPGLLDALFAERAGRVRGEFGGFLLFEFSEQFLARIDGKNDECDEEGEVGDQRVVCRTCPMCGKETSLELTKDEVGRYEYYLSGAPLLQEAFPNLTPSEREFLKTGYCPECQRKIFGNKIKSVRLKVEE